MSTAREAILAKIRQAVGGSNLSGHQTIPRRYREHGTLSLIGRCHLFKDRLIDYGSSVRFCSEAEIAHTVGQMLEARGKNRLIIPPALDRNWLPAALEFRIDTALTYADLDASSGTLTGCAIAIAATGTIVLRHSLAEGRRALTLIPDYHLCIVGAHQIVETVTEGIRHMAQFENAPITTVSGPSATADIEMTRIQGVHGPRLLDVIVWGVPQGLS